MVAAGRKDFLPWERLTELGERLSKAFCAFNSDEEGGAHGGGCLVQCWEPKTSASGELFLDTKELPASICGVGDALALFRCMCCRHHLYPALGLGGELSVVGEVFSTGEAALSYTVNPEAGFGADFLDKGVTSEGVHYSICLPLFSDTTRSCVIGVLEVVCLDNNVAVESTVRHLMDCLEVAQICSMSVTAFADLQADLSNLIEIAA